MEAPPPQPEHFSERHPRISGAAYLLVAAPLAKWQIYDPLHALEHGRPNLWVSGWLIGLAVLLGVYGAAMCVFGRTAVEWLRVDPQNMSWRFAIAASAVAFSGLAVFVLVMLRLADYGYVSRPFGL